MQRKTNRQSHLEYFMNIYAHMKIEFEMKMKSPFPPKLKNYHILRWVF